MEKKRYIIPNMEIIDIQTGSDILHVSGVKSNRELHYTGGGNGFSRARNYFFRSGWEDDD